ncbi:condensation domain-containing protein [Actinoplanes missouriensis]|uniref:condensation domain-containing protein n=1 Tax=Actinoplanes missouriensis TaxID=1866 RepID=UPI00340FF1CE
MQEESVRSDAELLPLAPSQEAIWEFIHYFSPGDPGAERFNVCDFRLLEGQVHLPALYDAIDDVAGRHDALRIEFAELGPDPLLRILSDLRPMVSFVDLSDIAEEKQPEQVARLIRESSEQVFDFRKAPLWSISLVRIAPERHLVVAGFSHLVCDGRSLSVFFTDLMRSYRVRRGDLSPTAPATPDVTFREIAELQRIAQDSAAEDCPTAGLGPARPVLLFPTKAQRGERSGADMVAEASYAFAFDDGISTGVRRLAWQLRTTPFVVLLAAYQVCLRLRTGLDGLRIGTVTLARGGMDGAAQTMGQFTTNVYLLSSARADVALRDVVTETHARLKCETTRGWHFKRIARAVHPDFEKERPWPFVHLFHSWFQADPVKFQEDDRAGDLSISRPDLYCPTGVTADGPLLPPAGDLELWMKRGAPSISVNHARTGGTVTYNPCFFEAHVAAGLAEDYRRAVRHIVERPDLPVGRIRLHQD